MTTGADQPTLTYVTSRDGTEIAYWTSGDGPPLVLVHGAAGDHTRWRPLLPHLEPQTTVHAMDRRGRGASGDASEYDLEREYEDVAAVIDAVARASGSRVDVYGHSYGGACAFGAAPLTRNIHRLVLYEGWPSVRPESHALPAGVEERMERALAEGDREEVVITLMRDGLAFSEEELATFRAAPSWVGRVAAAHTLPRELRAARTVRLDPERASGISVPVLLITGELSTDPARADVEHVAKALPNARTLVLPGQQHVADAMIPEAFAAHVLAFLREES